LIDEDGSQSKSLGRDQTFGGNFSMTIENAFEVFIKILIGAGTQLMEDASNLHAIIGVG